MGHFAGLSFWRRRACGCAVLFRCKVGYRPRQTRKSLSVSFCSSLCYYFYGMRQQLFSEFRVDHAVMSIDASEPLANFKSFKNNLEHSKMMLDTRYFGCKKKILICWCTLKGNEIRHTSIYDFQQNKSWSTVSRKCSFFPSSIKTNTNISVNRRIFSCKCNLEKRSVRCF